MKFISLTFNFHGRMVKRNKLNQILDDLDFYPAVAIVGPRQVGKTTLAKSFAEYLQKPILYLDLESDRDVAKLTDAESYLESHEDKCVVIDEIQLMPQLFPLLRSLIDRKRTTARFVLLGSASPNLLRNSTESLAGRIAYHELTPFSIIEVNELATMKEHWFKGGFPIAFLSKDIARGQKWLENLAYTFVEKDLRGMGYEVSNQTLTRFIRMLTHIHGNVLNISDLGRSMDVSQPTIKFYLELLQGGYWIELLQPYFANVSKRLVKAPKIYIRDSGLLHTLARVGNFELLLSNTLLGASWEGYVIEEIKRTMGTQWEYYFYRTHNGAECDLIAITQKGEKVCIEIKYSNAPKVSKGFYQSVEDIQPNHKYVIIPDGEKYTIGDGVWVCGLKEFLLNEIKQLL